MNAKIATFTALIALVGAASAFAAEGTQDFPAGGISTASRAEVRAQIGKLSYGEASEAPVAKSTLTRTQVVAEAREAQRLGLLDGGEVTKIATPAQADQIRNAGLRALQGSTTVAQMR